MKSQVKFPQNISGASQQNHCSIFFLNSWCSWEFILNWLHTARPVSLHSPGASTSQIDLKRCFLHPLKAKCLSKKWFQSKVGTQAHAGGALWRNTYCFRLFFHILKQVLSYFSCVGECCETCFAVKLWKCFHRHEGEWIIDQIHFGELLLYVQQTKTQNAEFNWIYSYNQCVIPWR